VAGYSGTRLPLCAGPLSVVANRCSRDRAAIPRRPARASSSVRSGTARTAPRSSWQRPAVAVGPQASSPTAIWRNRGRRSWASRTRGSRAPPWAC